MKKTISFTLFILVLFLLTIAITSCAHEHTWNEGEITIVATCETDGTKTFTCVECDTTMTDTISATGHAWGNGDITTSATCETEGVTTFSCVNCEITKTETIPTTEHIWDEGKITTSATREFDGEKTFTCINCQTTRTEAVKSVLTVTEEEWIAALNLLLNNNYVQTESYSMGESKSTLVTQKNGNNISVTSSQGAQSYTQYWIVENNKYRTYQNNDASIADSTYWNYQFEYHNIFLYNDFKFDETTKSYISDKIVYKATAFSTDPNAESPEWIFTNLSFQFLDGKLVSLSYTQSFDAEMGGMTMDSTQSITYGNAPEITLPSLN